MKSFKLTADGDLSFTDGDKMKPYTIVGKSYQAGIPSPENPLPIIGVTTPFLFDYDGNGSMYKPERLVLQGMGDESGNYYADTLDVDPIKGICTLTRRVGVGTIRVCVKIAQYIENRNVVLARTYPSDSQLNHIDGVLLGDWGEPLKKISGLNYLCTHFPNNKNADENVHCGNYGMYSDYLPFVQLKSERFTEEEIADDRLEGLLVKACTSLLAEWQPQIIFPLKEPIIFEFPYTSNYNHQIEMVEGAELTAQKIKTVLGTNKGEWFFDEEEGINFDNILGKKRLGNADSSNAVIEDSGELNAILTKRLDGVQ